MARIRETWRRWRRPALRSWTETPSGPLVIRAARAGDALRDDPAA